MDRSRLPPNAGGVPDVTTGTISQVCSGEVHGELPGGLPRCLGRGTFLTGLITFLPPPIRSPRRGLPEYRSYTPPVARRARRESGFRCFARHPEASGEFATLLARPSRWRAADDSLPGVRPRRRVTRARREPKSAGFHGPPFGSLKCGRTVTSHDPYSLPFSGTVASLV